MRSRRRCRGGSRPRSGARQRRRREIGLEQRPAVLASGTLPGRDRPRSPLRISAAACSSRATTSSISAATASEFELKMSAQTTGLAPATRVASRKLRPTSGRRSPSLPIDPAAAATSALASTCGRWLIAAISRSWSSASIAIGRAPIPARTPWRRSNRTPWERSVGVRYQRAPSNRSWREPSTPAVSAPASGCPPMKRSEPVASAIAATSACFVEPTSVTTASGPAVSSAVATRSGRAVTGAAQKTTSAPATASAAEPSVRSTAPSATARLDVLRVRIPAGDLGPEPVARGEPDRAADQPDAENGDPGRMIGLPAIGRSLLKPAAERPVPRPRRRSGRARRSRRSPRHRSPEGRRRRHSQGRRGPRR